MNDSDTKRTSHWLALIFCFIVFLGVCKLYLDKYIEIRKLEERLAERKVELVTITNQVDDLSAEVEFIASLDGIEKMAREKLKYIKEGEVIIVPGGR